MKNRPTWMVLAICAALWACMTPLSVAAQAIPAPALREVRELVEDYELRAGLEAITKLSHELRGGKLRGADLAEARFLRAITAADLLLLSGYAEWENIEGRLARALGVPRADLVPSVDRALEESRLGRFIPLVDDARAALAARYAGASPARIGSRTDLVYLDRVSAILTALPRPDAFAPLGTDPCVDGECETRLLQYSEASRRAYSALERALSSITRLVHASDFGDPFARAAEEGLHHLSKRLLGTAIELRPSLPEDVGPIEGDGDFDTLVAVQEDGIVVQSKARVRLDPRGLALPNDGACGSRHFIRRGKRMQKELVETLRQSRSGCGNRVVISASDELEVEDFFSAIRSVRRAGSTLIGVAGRKQDGEVGVREFAIVQGRKPSVPLLTIEPESITYTVAAKRRVLSLSPADMGAANEALPEHARIERLAEEIEGENRSEGEPEPLIIRASDRVNFEQLRIALRLERARIALWVR